MKNKITRKHINLYFNNVVNVGYCKLQYLLFNYTPFAYNEGVFGWNFDTYNIHNVIICTGYRNLPGKPAVGAMEYENKAKSIYYSDKLTWEQKGIQIEILLHEFCKTNGGF